MYTSFWGVYVLDVSSQQQIDNTAPTKMPQRDRKNKISRGDRCSNFLSHFWTWYSARKVVPKWDKRKRSLLQPNRFVYTQNCDSCYCLCENIYLEQLNSLVMLLIWKQRIKFIFHWNDDHVRNSVCPPSWKYEIIHILIILVILLYLL